MKLFLVYDHLYLGGIETLIVRMSNWLASNGHEVCLGLNRKEGELLLDLDEKVEVVTPISPRNPQFSGFDVYMAMAPAQLVLAHDIFLRTKHAKSKFLIGVYHPNDYELYANSIERLYLKNVVLEESIVFMSEPVREAHEMLLKRSYSDAHIWPLALDTTRYVLHQSPRRRNLVISVGRLTGFKTYNLYMLNVIRQLVDEGGDIEYHIYGEGALMEEIRSRIVELDLDAVVSLKGIVPYSELNNAFRDARVFVGMGTSAIEAGLFGVPSIAAIPFSKKPESHGFIHELPGFNCGERIDGRRVYLVADLIKQVFRMDEESYGAFTKSARDILVQKYDINSRMIEFLEIVTSNRGYNGSLDLKTFILQKAHKIHGWILKLWKQLKTKVKRIIAFSE